MLSASRNLFSRRSAPLVRVVSRGYHDNIVEHYENPRNVGSMDKNDASVGTVSPFFALVTVVTFDTFSLVPCLPWYKYAYCTATPVRFSTV